MKKVTAKHLMIGDWVRCRKQYCIVTQLPIVFDEHRIMLESTHRSFGSASATPIPITEEWLMLNGAKNIDGSFVMYISECFMITYTFEMGVRIYKYNGMIIWVLDAKYIHQLQQAYRLATKGKELKIKF